MLKILTIFIFIAVAATAGYALKDYDFMLSGEVMGYFISVSTAFLAAAFFFLVLVLYLLIRVLWWVKTSPSRIAGRIKKDKEAKAYKEIMFGFSALAAADYNAANKHGEYAAKILPKQPLVKLLQAQTANAIGNKEKALELYKDLSQTEEGKFVGYRGLIANAIENKQPLQAIQNAEELLKTSPKSRWLNEAVIDLAFRMQDWERVEKFIKKAEANRAIPKADLALRFAIFYYYKAKTARADKRFEDAIWHAEKSIKYKDDFAPNAILYSSLLISSGEFKKARKHIENCWKFCPHPLLAADFERAIQEFKPEKQLKLSEDLFYKNASDYESVLFYAKALINAGKNAEAAEMLKKAATYRQTRSLCALMAQIDDAKTWQQRKDTAEDDKCWYCTKTGARYNEWQAFSDSGEIGTITWGFPPKISESAYIANQFQLIK